MATQTASLSLIDPNRAMLERAFAQQLTQIEPESTQPQSTALSTVIYNDRIRELAEKELLLKALRNLLQQTLGYFGYKFERGDRLDQSLTIDDEIKMQNFVSGAVKALEDEHTRRQEYVSSRLDALKFELEINDATSQRHGHAVKLHAGAQNVASAFETGIQRAGELNAREETCQQLAQKSQRTAEHLYTSLAEGCTPRFPGWLPVPEAITTLFDDRADRRASEHLETICELTANPRKGQGEVRKFHSSPEYQKYIAAGHKQPVRTALDVYVARLKLKGVDPTEALSAYQAVAQQLHKQAMTTVDRNQARRAIAIVRNPLAAAEHIAAADSARQAYQQQMTGDINALIEGQKSYRTAFRNKGNSLERTVAQLKKDIEANPEAVSGLAEGTQAVLGAVQSGDLHNLATHLKDPKTSESLAAQAKGLEFEGQRLQQNRQVLTMESGALKNGLAAFRVGMQDVMRKFALCFEIDQTDRIKRTGSMHDIAQAFEESRQLYTSSRVSGPVFAPLLHAGDVMGKFQDALRGVAQGALQQANNIASMSIGRHPGQEPDAIAVMAYSMSGKSR